MSKQSNEIRQAILREVFWRSDSPVMQVAHQFKVTPQAVQLHVKALIERGELSAAGQKRYRRYTLAILADHQKAYSLKTGITEDDIWRSFVAALVTDLSAEERDISHYGLTEMVNNTIDHSGGSKIHVRVCRTAVSMEIHVIDNGEGIFQKIAHAMGVDDSRQALLELSKGKFTTDPKRHTGEGIFFSSRLFDRYQLRSDDLLFYHSTRTDDWLVTTEDKSIRGTHISMALVLPSSTMMREVFSRFSSGPEDYRFARTQVPLKLATFEDEALLSRSSAKRVLNRVERFDEVVLDFSGIRSIGQAFADEIFRVFCNAHPKVELIAINANAPVTEMIRRAQAARREQT
jgi:anti-sigma regulatory factor (Ser/Thr protein kinase)